MNVRNNSTAAAGVATVTCPIPVAAIIGAADVLDRVNGLTSKSLAAKHLTAGSTMTLREHLESLIEAAIDMLDELDGNTDCEDDGTTEPSIEPSIGLDRTGRLYWAGDDREDNCHAA